MSAALRTTQATPSMRPLAAAFAGVVIAVAILGLLASVQLTAAQPQTAPAAVSAPVLHDRGLATAPSIVASAPVLHDRGLATAPSVASTPATASDGSRSGIHGGSNGTRFRK